jgi:hypothetical protein
VVSNRLKDDVLFRDAFERDDERGKAAIRIAQFRKAVIEKDTNALIWAGKIRLGQRERREFGGIEGGAPIAQIVQLTLSAAKAEMDSGGSVSGIQKIDESLTFYSSPIVPHHRVWNTGFWAGQNGVHRREVRQALASAMPAERKIPERERPKLAAAIPFIDGILPPRSTQPGFQSRDRKAWTPKLSVGSHHQQ